MDFLHMDSHLYLCYLQSIYRRQVLTAKPRLYVIPKFTHSFFINNFIILFKEHVFMIKKKIGLRHTKPCRIIGKLPQKPSLGPERCEILPTLTSDMSGPAKASPGGQVLVSKAGFPFFFCQQLHLSNSY